MPRRRYTPDEVAQIRQWATEGRTAKYIAEQVGRAVGSIYVFVSKNKIALASPEKYRAAARRAHERRDRLKHSEACSRAWTPERKAVLSALMKKRIAEGSFANGWPRSPESRASMTQGARRANLAKMSWCPLEKRQRYDRLRKRKGAQAAKTEILMDIAREMQVSAPRRRLSFEEQLERARGGAAVVELYRPAANDTAMGRSLIGCSLG